MEAWGWDCATIADNDNRWQIHTSEVKEGSDDTAEEATMMIKQERLSPVQEQDDCEDDELDIGEVEVKTEEEEEMLVDAPRITEGVEDPLGTPAMSTQPSSSGPRPFSCKICYKTFPRDSDMMKHRQMHRGLKPLECPDCGKTFSFHSALARHRRIHTGERPFKCGECAKSFTQKIVLLVHRRTHTGERPYKCEECGKSFMWKGDLVVHKRMHTGEKPFACEICNMRFSYCASIKRHIANIHGGLL